MKKIKAVYWAYLAIILAPIVINYTLFTWRAPYVFGDSNSWLGFFANYLGFIGAFTIAIMQFRNQTKTDRKRDLESSRSFLIVHDFSAPVKLKGIKTHENSRIIETPYYKDFLKWIPREEYDTTNTVFYKISHSGSSEFILDCHIQIKIHSQDRSDSYLIDVNVGVFEKGIEVFIPLAKRGIKEILIDEAVIEYTTLKGERMKYFKDLINKKETHLLLHSDGTEKIIMEFNLEGSTWIYPNKFENKA